MFKIYAIQHLFENFETFYRNMGSAATQKYFIPKMDSYKKVLKDDMKLLAMSSLDIVDGFDM